MTRVAIVGGGIAGLAAAWEALNSDRSHDVSVIEAGPRFGGKIATEPFAGIDLDTGADAFLARVPAASDLARQVGLGAELVAPGTGQAWLWARGALRRLPAGLVLGVPADLAALRRSAVLPWAATARAALDLILPASPIDGDIAIGELVRRRMGRTVQLGLVDPLVGGINAGHTDHLSAAVVAPQLLAAAQRDRSLIRGLRSLGTAGSPDGAVRAGSANLGGAPRQPVVGGGPGETGAAAPVFLTVRGGMQRLVDATVAALRASGCQLHLADPVIQLSRVDGVWRLVRRSGQTAHADAVVIACPPEAARTLVRPLSAPAAEILAAIRMASVALTTLCYPSTAFDGAPAGSGFLVPRTEGRLLTACSWVGSKWPHLDRPGQIVIRASAGRIDDERALGMKDGALVDSLHGELTAAMGLRGRPSEARVHRWEGAFPQFEVGHLERIARLEAQLARDAPGLAVAGAALRGVGIATCITGARSATRAALDQATTTTG